MTGNYFNFDPELLKLAERAEAECTAEFAECERIRNINSEKVLWSFIKNKVSDACLSGSTGYGYGDVGRDVIDRVFADAFDAEDAIVRHNFVSGTHAISTALFGILRSGDKLVSITGSPYDTLEEVIGIRGEKGAGSLKNFGIEYSQLDLLENGSVDIEGIPDAVKGARVVYIQRSRGYSLRPAISIQNLKSIIDCVKQSSPDSAVVIDNCYGEFVDEKEPLSVGADIIIGSLIKNPGGGIAQTGGYIAGKKELVELCADRLTCIGMGREVGCTLNQNRNILLGFFFAPDVVANAVKTSAFAARLFELLGFESFPKTKEKRSDIITAVKLGNERLLTAFCRGIQSGSPIDSFVTPEAWDMPGYDSKVIMAAGAFTMGASIELSADAPIREPFAVWLQGGLTYTSGKIGILSAAREVIKNI